MKDLLQRMMSRKFLLALGSFFVFIANGQYTEATAVVIAYLGINGATEAFAGSKTTKIIETPESYNISDVDTSRVVTGNTPLFDEVEKKD